MNAQQPELYAYNGGDNITGISRVFEPVVLPGHKYYLAQYPNYYFVVRADLYRPGAEHERVCLYREGVINRYLKGDETPFTLWVSNELRAGRSLQVMYERFVNLDLKGI